MPNDFPATPGFFVAGSRPPAAGRRLTRRRFLALVGAAGTSVTLAACAGQRGPAGQPAPTTSQTRGGKLVVGVRFNSANLDPVTTNDGDAHALLNLYEPLIRVNNRGELTPGLAVSWEQPGPRTFLLKLRSGMTFHDGTPVDAEAVKLHLERVKDPASRSPSAADVAAIQSVQSVDSSTVRIDVERPAAELLPSLTGRAGFIASPTAADLHGQDFASNPVGAGAFKLKEWVRDDHVTLERFDGYWESGRPLVDELVFRPVPDDQAKLIQLRGGSIQVSDWVPYHEVDRLRQGAEVKIEEIGWFRSTYINLNNARPPFDRLDLRQAVAIGIDREAIHRSVGLGQPGQGPLPTTSPFFNPRLNEFTRSLDLAREKLRAGGQPNGFRFALEVFNDPLFIQYAQIVKANLEEIGVVMEIRVGDRNAIQARVRRGDYEADFNGNNWRADPDGILYPMLHSKGPGNTGKYGNPAVDEMLENARRTYNVEERKKLYQEIEATAVREAARVWIHHDPRFHGLSPRVEGYEPRTDGWIELKSASLRA